MRCMLTKLYPSPRSDVAYGGHLYYTFLCECGKKKVIRKDHVEMGKIVSCGCYQATKAITHGMSKTRGNFRIYNTWDSMIQRCTNSNNAKYTCYGGRGIAVCEEWLDFAKFYKDMGDPEEGMSLERIDVNGNYCKENCKWATASEQGYNQRKRNTNTSGRTGVYFDTKRNKWVASICFMYKNISLGRFDEFEDAVRAREEAELKYFGFNKE